MPSSASPLATIGAIADGVAATFVFAFIASAMPYYAATGCMLAAVLVVSVLFLYV